MSTITSAEAVEKFRALVKYRMHLESLEHVQKMLLEWLDKRKENWKYGGVAAIKLRSLR